MEKDKIKMANKKLEEIEDLQRINKFLAKDNEYRNAVHFKILQHFGDGADDIKISRIHNNALLDLVRNIISNIEEEIRNL